MDRSDVSVRMLLWTVFAGIGFYWSFKIFWRIYQLYTIRRSVKKHWPSRPYHWFWGHTEMVNIIRNHPERLIGLITSLSEDFKYGTGLYLGPLITFMRVVHRNFFKVILGGSEKRFPKSDAQYRFLHPWLGSKGLLLLGGNEWHRHRQLLSNSFHFDILRAYTIKMNECSVVLIEKWNSKFANNDDEISVELFNDFSLMTIDAIMKCLMGFERNSQIEEGEHQQYVATIHRITNVITERFRTQNPLMRFDTFYYLTNNGRKFVKYVKEVREYAEKVIDLRRKEYADGATIGSKLGLNRKSQRHYDFLDVLLQARDLDGNSLTNKEVSDEVNTFIFEGHDTTTSAIAWTCCCLALNPDCQEKCLQEIKKIIAEKDAVEFEDLAQFKYITMCIKETLRLFPPVPSIARKPTSDIEIDGKPIKKGAEVILSLIGAHYDPTIWPEPKKFNPLRFTPENIAERDPYAYVPFSAGLRNCIGQNFAMNEIKIFLVHVLCNFQLFADEEKPPVPLVELILRTKGGLHLRVKKRNMS